MVNFGIVGCGNIANKFAEAISLVPEANLAAVASKDLERSKSFAEKHGVSLFFDDYDKLFSSESVDIVYVATTCNFHYENIKSAIEHGKSVIAEKAMVTSSKDAEYLFALAKEKGVFLFEGMWSLFIPTIQKVRDWVQKGRLGDIYLAHYLGGINAHKDNRIFNKNLGGGSFLDLTVYPYEILSFLLGVPGTLVKADVETQEDVDVVNSAILKFGKTKAIIATTAFSRIPSPSGLFGNKGYVLIEQTHRCDTIRLFDGNFELVEEFSHPISNGFEYEIMHAIDLFKIKKNYSDIASPEITVSFLKFMEESLNER